MVLKLYRSDWIIDDKWVRIVVARSVVVVEESGAIGPAITVPVSENVPKIGDGVVPEQAQLP